MNKTEVYLRAAELVAAGPECGVSCLYLQDVVGTNHAQWHPLTKAYQNVFSDGLNSIAGIGRT